MGSWQSPAARSGLARARRMALPPLSLWGQWRAPLLHPTRPDRQAKLAQGRDLSGDEMQNAVRNTLSPVHVCIVGSILPAGYVACLLPLARNHDHSRPPTDGANGWCRIIARLRPLARAEQAQGMQQHAKVADERTLLLAATGDQKAPEPYLQSRHCPHLRCHACSAAAKRHKWILNKSAAQNLLQCVTTPMCQIHQ